MMRHLILMICLLFLLVPILAQENESPEPTSLLEIHYALNTLDSLEARGSISHENAETERAYYIAAAESLTGEALSPAEISERAFQSEGSIFRFLNFVNVIWALAGVMIVISLIWIFVVYIARYIPVSFYELLAYCAAFAFIWYGQYTTLGTEQFVALPGILGLGVLFPFSYFWHLAKKRQHSHEFHRNALVLIFLALSLIWGYVAIRYNSEMIGFFTVLAGLWTLTLTRWVKLLLQPFGYREERPSIEILLMCGLLMLIYLWAETQGIVGAYRVFGFGVYWIGNYGYFAALEFMASKWRKSQKSYLAWQFFAVFSGVLGLFLGIFWNVDSLSETAGTFLLVYTLTKYLEIFNWRRHWAWASLGLGVLLYALGYLINAYPQFFLLT